MRKSILKLNTFTTILAMAFAIIFNTITFCQMPPHPDLLKKVKDGSILKPYVMSNLNEIQKIGVDAPWSDAALINNKTPGKISRTNGPALTPTGNWRALVLLVKFSDKPSSVLATSFDNLIFSQTSGTLWDYYKIVSYGALDIVTVNLPSTTNWYTAPQTYSYYVNGMNGFGTYPQNAQKLAEDVVQLANPLIDYSNYDNDGDGYVDALFVVHSGPGAEYTGSSNDIWSHAWVLNSSLNLDGVNVWRYSMEPEYWQNPGDMTIGVYAHELGHSGFGLPDLYDRDYSSNGLGLWSLMAGGSWGGTLGNSPSFPDAWSHYQMGYLTPTVITSNTNSVSIPNVEQNPSAYLLWSNGSVGSQYFLVENRQNVSYDNSLPGAGLCIYHVDENVSTQNDKEWYPGYTSSGHYLVALEQADGLWELERDLSSANSGDVYPGSTSNYFFNDNTTPDSKDYSFSSTGVAANNISVSGTTLTADFEVQSASWLGTYLVWDAAGNNTSAPVIKSTLEYLGYTVDMTSNLSSVPNIFQYQSVFVCLVIYSNNYVLQETDAAVLNPFLQAGGKVYMEGGDTWAYDTRTSLHDYFNILGIADGSGDLTTVSGINGTFTEGMTFNYSGSNSYIDRLGTQNGSIPILENTSVPYSCAVAFDGGTYRTIGTSFEFGGLDEGATPSTKAELMVKILDFFNSGGSMKLPPTNVVAGNGFKDIVPITWDPPLNAVPKLQAAVDESISGGSASQDKNRAYLEKLLVGRKFIDYNPELFNDTVSYYKIYRSLTAGGPYSYLASVDPHGRIYGDNEDYVDDAVTNGTSYYYVITAVYTDEEESGYSPQVEALPNSLGKIINSSYSTNSVTVDGIMNLSEWSDATVIDISRPGVASPITVRIKNDDNFLYIAVDDPNNTSDSDGSNGLGFYFDDDNNKTWDASSPTSEGNYWLYLDGGVVNNRFRGIYGTYPDNLGFETSIYDPPGVVSVGSMGSGYLRTETKIDLSASVLNAAPGGTIGAYFFEYDPSITLPQGYHHSGVWPYGAIWPAPETYGEITLAAGGGIVPPHSLTANLNPQNGEVALAWQHSSTAGAVYEDFTGTSTNTFVYSDGRFAQSSGYLVMTGASNDTWASMYYDGNFDDFLVEYEFERSDGDLGYTIGSFLRADGFIGTGTDNGYLIATTASGYYSVWLHQNGVESAIIPWTTSSLINTGYNIPNIVSVIAAGNNIQLYVNGQYLDEFINSTFTIGKVNLCTFDAFGYNNIVKWDFLNIIPSSKKLLAGNTGKKADSQIRFEGGSSNKAPGNSITNNFNTPRTLDVELSPSIENFRNFRIYRNSILIDSTVNKNYLDVLPGFGTYSYLVTAFYDEEETTPAGPETVDWQPSPFISVRPLALTANILGDTINTKSFVIYNLGSANLTFNLTEIEIFKKLAMVYPNTDGPSISKNEISEAGKVKINVKPKVQLVKNGIPTEAVLWLDESPLSGTILPGDSAVIVVTFDGTGLAAGSYFAEIEVASNDSYNPFVNVNATLNKLVENFTTVDNENNLIQGIPDGDMDVYLFNDDPLAPIEFNIFVSNSVINSAQLSILAWDIDWDNGERDSVTLNGHFVGYLTGANGEWSTSLFNIDPSWIVPGPTGKNLVQVFIDILNVSYWAVTVDWGQLIINGSSGNAQFRYVNTDKTIYNPGENVIITGEADADPNMSVRVETNLVDPFNQIIAGTSRTFTATQGDEPYQETLAIPGGSSDGLYKVMSLLYDAASNILQDQLFVNFNVQSQNPTISVTPDSFFVGLTSGDSTTLSLNISNSGNAALNFNIHAVPVLTKSVLSTQKIDVANASKTIQKNSNVSVKMMAQYTGEKLSFGISEYGEIMPFMFPVGTEHLAFGSLYSGYTIAFEVGGTDKVEFAGYEVRYGLTPVSYTTVLDDSNFAIVEAIVSTSGGELKIIRKFTFPKTEQFVRIETFIANQSSYNISNVVFKEWTDWDNNGSYENDWGFDITRNMPYAHEVQFTSIVPGQTPSIIDIDGWDDVDVRLTNGNVPPGLIPEFDGLELLHYNLGSLAIGSRISLLNVYAAADNLTELQLAADKGVGAFWLTFNPVNGVVPQGSNTSVDVKFNAKNLASGMYHANILIENNDPTNPLVAVPATLNVAPSAQIAWTNTLLVADNNNENTTLTFGQAPLASDGIDNFLGELPLPPTPPSGIFDSRFELPIVPSDFSLIDFRNDSLTSATWRVKFQPGVGGYPMNFSWDSSAFPAGSFILKDEITGTIVNVNMKNQSSCILTNSGISSLLILYSMQTCLDVPLLTGWNIMSVPVVATDMNTSTLFPDATSPTYGFNGGYYTATMLENGLGYWIRYPNAATIEVCGTAVSLLTIPINSGWNLIGPYAVDILVSSIATNPAGILTSPFYGYDNGYFVPTILNVGVGYWIRSSQAGEIIIPTTSLAKSGQHQFVQKVGDDWGDIIVTDADGKSFHLYISSSSNGLMAFDLPPAPPSGIKDVRFGTDRIAENLKDGSKELRLSSLKYPVRVSVEKASVQISDNINGKLFNKFLRDGDAVVVENSTLNKLMVSLLEVPTEYQLSQNYPNPFNPSTKIRFGVPEKTKVRIAIFSQLGELVEEITNTIYEPGYYELSWMAKPYASGLYFYQMTTGKFSSTKKMLLIK